MANRNTPRFSVQAKVLNEQDYRCGYCLFPFGSVVYRQGNREVTSLTWDHFVPYSYIQNNPDANWVAACQVCNRLKSSLIFDNIGEARIYVLKRWEDRAYTIIWEPSVSSEEDVDTWTIEYEKFCPSDVLVVEDKEPVPVTAHLRLSGSVTGGRQMTLPPYQPPPRPRARAYARAYARGSLYDWRGDDYWPGG